MKARPKPKGAKSITPKKKSKQIATATKRISRAEAAKAAKAKKARDALSSEVYQALVRAQESARKTARMHGTLVYFWKDGKVVGEKP